MDDLDRLSSDFQKAQKQTKRLISEVVLDYGDKVAGSMRELAPVGASGDLKASITVALSAAAGDLSVEVGPEVWYAHFTERGTSRQPPQNYAGQAFDRHVDGFVDDVLAIAADNLW